jgi:hypothetical protein
MTKKQIEDLANLIVDKLIDKQKELDKEFIQDLELSNVPIEVHHKIDPKDKIVIEITRLNVMLEQFERLENYEMAIKCSHRINDLKNMLKDIK